jgi:hypothetical protein
VKVGDLVKFVMPPGMIMEDVGQWKQKSPGIVLGTRNTGVTIKPSYKILWNGGGITYEWNCYLEVLGESG